MDFAERKTYEKSTPNVPTCLDAVEFDLKLTLDKCYKSNSVCRVPEGKYWLTHFVCFRRDCAVP